jgi:RNA polymerase sigma-B factor
VPRTRSGVDIGVPAVQADVWLDHVLVARHRDPDALARLVHEYDRYARSLASRLHRSNEPHEDLDQIALEALIVALHRFDPERGIPFPAFATPTILGALRRHYRDHGWLVRVPRRVHDYTVAERTVVDRLMVERGRAPTTAELAEALGMTIDEVLLAQEAVHARDARSLDAVVGDELRLVDQLGREDGRLAGADDRMVAAAAIAQLDEDDRELLRQYFVEERSQASIAEERGVSQMQISRLLASILRRLRANASV